MTRTHIRPTPLSNLSSFIRPIPRLFAGLTSGLSAQLTSGLSAGLNSHLSFGPFPGATHHLTSGLSAQLISGLTSGLSAGLNSHLSFGPFPEATHHLTSGPSARLTSGPSAQLTSGLTPRSFAGRLPLSSRIARSLLTPVFFLLLASASQAQKSTRDLSKDGPAVIGYYAGKNALLDSFHTEKLTHIIYSFCHLNGNRMYVSNANDSATIRHMVALKVKNPGLKVILSLGGWGGCKTCPDVFATDQGRSEFARSVKELTDYFHTDGIDLDWEYPGLANVPGYVFYSRDKDHFTDLIVVLRKELGKQHEISFAAGGFTSYLVNSIDWKKVTPLVNYINLMTYDLVSGYDTITGHHTPLYSTPQQLESTDHAVRFLDSIGVPLKKIAIGVAFYARIWEGVDSVNDGLYRHGTFKTGVSYKDQARFLSKDSGYIAHWDPVAKAPYMYNPSRQLYVTYDDSVSIRLKSRYALEKHLGGIMFWQLPEDLYSGGLLDVIDAAKKEALKR